MSVGSPHAGGGGSEEDGRGDSLSSSLSPFSRKRGSTKLEAGVGGDAASSSPETGAGGGGGGGIGKGKSERGGGGYVSMDAMDPFNPVSICSWMSFAVEYTGLEAEC